MKAYKTELDPNNSQITFFFRCRGASRYVFNWGRARWEEQYKSGGKPSEYSLRKEFNSIKDELCPWIRELPYAVSEGALANLGAAYQNFFRRVKSGEDPGYPKFKKRGHSGSFHIRNARIFEDGVVITGAGFIRLKECGYIPFGKHQYGTYATISERAGRWYISVLVKDEEDKQSPELSGTIGVDLGILHLAVCSDGSVYDNPKALVSSQSKLSRLNRELSRRKKGGKNWEKTRKKLARTHGRISNIRQHALHQVSSEIVGKNPERIVLEDLNVVGMLSNHHLARSLSDASLSELSRQIQYKGAGIETVLADRWFPSSKMCSGCGSVKPKLSLSDRIYKCDVCGLEIDRDLNAARNLAAYNQKAETQPDCLGSSVAVGADCELGTR